MCSAFDYSLVSHQHKVGKNRYENKVVVLSKALHSASCHGNNQGQILLKPGMYSCNFGKNNKKTYDTESKVMYVMDTQQCQ